MPAYDLEIRIWLSKLIRTPFDSPLALVATSTCETEDILYKASPLNPKVSIDSKSDSEYILLVECLSKATSTSSSSIPLPLSDTTMEFIPPAEVEINILSAPASKEFSTNSFTTDAGRSITSPAAIKAAISGERILITDIVLSTFSGNWLKSPMI